MDTPCWGDPPDGCATLPPPPRRASVESSEPFTRAKVDVPIDRLGEYRINLGHATIPDGRLTELSLRLADPRPASFWIEAGVRLELESDVPGRPPVGNVHRDGFDGPEPVTVYLTFNVTEFESAGVLGVRDIVVR
jgi:hypothetical protein